MGFGGSNRNGSSAKTVLTDAGSIPVMVPRDRNGTFEPKLIPKHQRRLNGFNDVIISLIARGMTTRDVQAHIADVYQVEISPEWALALIRRMGLNVLSTFKAVLLRHLQIVAKMLVSILIRHMRIAIFLLENCT